MDSMVGDGGLHRDYEQYVGMFSFLGLSVVNNMKLLAAFEVLESSCAYVVPWQH